MTMSSWCMGLEVRLTELEQRVKQLEPMAMHMTKREYFAAMAMQCYLIGDAAADFPDDKIAAWSVSTADALIAELNKEDV